MNYYITPELANIVSDKKGGNSIFPTGLLRPNKSGLATTEEA